MDFKCVVEVEEVLKSTKKKYKKDYFHTIWESVVVLVSKKCLVQTLAMQLMFSLLFFPIVYFSPKRRSRIFRCKLSKEPSKLFPTALPSLLTESVVVKGMKSYRPPYLSLDMLQSMTVFLLVFTMIKGRWIAVLGAGEPCSFSTCLFLWTRFLKAICWKGITEMLVQTIMLNLLQLKLSVSGHSCKKTALLRITLTKPCLNSHTNSVFSHSCKRHSHRQMQTLLIFVFKLP